MTPNLCVAKACLLVDPAYPSARCYVVVEREDLALLQLQGIAQGRLREPLHAFEDQLIDDVGSALSDRNDNP